MWINVEYIISKGVCEENTSRRMYVMQTRLWPEGIQLRPEMQLIFYLLNCVLLTSTPTPTLNFPLIIMKKNCNYVCTV